MATQIGYTEQATSQPSWYQDLYKNLLQTGASNLNRGTGAYPGNLVAGFTPQQLQAGQLMQQQLGGWTPQYQAGLGTLQGALSQTQAASQYNPAQYQQFMNPYLTGVVNEIGRLGNQNLMENVLPGIADQYTSLGQFGSARQGTALAQAGARAQREISGQQAQALSAGYGQAQDIYGNWANRGLQGAQQAANVGGQQIGAAQSGQQMAFGDQQQLFGYGQQAQQTAQNQLTSQYQEWQRQQQQPWANLKNQAGLFGAASPPTTTSMTQTQFKRGGLAQMAEGGGFSWQIDDETQKHRDRLRRTLLDREREEYPNDEALLREIAGEDERGNTTGIEDKVSQLPPMLASLNDNQAQANPMADIRAAILEGLNRRRQSAEKVLTDPDFQPTPQKSTTERIGEAMLRAGAEGPAHWGQLIGRTGKEYLDTEQLRQGVNFTKAKVRAELEDKLSKLPSVSSLGGGAQAGGKLFRGVDGSQWAFDPVTKQKSLLVPGNYADKITKQATLAADSDLREAIGLTTEQKSAERQRLIDKYTRSLTENYAGLGGTPLKATAQVENSPETVSIAQTNNPPESLVPPKTVPMAPALAPSKLSLGSLNIPTPQEKKEQEEVGGAMGKEFSGIQKESREAEYNLQSYERMGQLLQDVNTGKLTPLGTEISAWIKAAGQVPGLAGFKERFQNWETLPNKEAAQSLMGQMALQMRNPSGGAGMPGAMSDKDREFLIKMVPSLSNTPEGIKLMMETQRKLTQRAQDVARLAREYREQNPRRTFDEGFYDHLSKWSNEHPLFEAQAKKAPRSVEEILKQYGGK